MNKFLLDFVSEEEADSFQGLLSSIDVVSQEQVVGLWRKGAVLEETEQVVVLAVHVAADFQRGLKLEKDWLRQEHLAGLKREIREEGIKVGLLLNIVL